MAEIKLGPAGSPAKSTLEGVSKVRELGLHAMEVEFVQGVRMKNDLARQVGKEARKRMISLSIHAPYFINLNSAEPEKIEASKKRILDSCERGHHMGARKIVFHPAFYGKSSPEKTFQITKTHVLDMQKTIRKKGWEVELAPETTGKNTVFGSLDETIRLVRETGCSLCADFAHLWARNRGNIDYGEMLDMIERLKEKNLHIHFSGIAYGMSGEKNHEVMNDSNPPFTPLAKEILERDLNVTIICESPITWKDSLRMKKIFEDLGHRFE